MLFHDLEELRRCYKVTSKEAVLELICEAKSVNRDEERVCFLRKIIEEDLETSEILKTIFKSIIKNYDDIDQNFTIYLNTELYDKLKELLNDK